jgi:predicted Zn-dependent peptidase
MKYKKIDMTSFNLHIIKTKRFKTINFRVCLRDKIKKEEITLRNALTSFLTYSTNTYRTKRDLVLKAQDLYAVNVYTKSYRSGRFNMINFCMSLLNEKYTEEGMLEKSVEFLADIMFNPNFQDEEAFQNAFKFLYDSIETSMKGVKENPTTYSVVRMLEEMDPDMPYGYREYGYLEDLKKLNRENLANYYDKIMKNSLVDIFVIGDVDENEIASLLKKYFKFSTFKRPKESQLIEHEKLPVRSKIIKEEVESNQSKLSIGCKIGSLTEFERNYVLTIYNMILGGNSESKFFQIIREKHSLAYYVYSSLNKLDSLLIIKAGISSENFDQTVKLVKKLMKDMVKGNFKDEHINIVKENYISLLKEIEDNENAIIETYLAKDLLNLGDIEERKREVMKVTKEDIVNVAKKIKIDTIFLLEGVENNESN